ncbi:MAG: transcription-repair coupling factor [Acidimicrobiales bacterium]|nr:transcription-repair coupling factor [Acidimicrobiales bacterium]
MADRNRSGRGAAGSLVDLPGLLADEPGIVSVLGRRSATLAVPEPAQAITLAALSRLVDRRPLVVVTPTGTDAERIHRDLSTWCGTDEVALFPAWETLPFERVSPSLETMGRRCQVLHDLRDPERGPAIVVTPIRAALQRLGPEAGESDPVIVGVGDVVDQHQLVEQLVSMGYRRDVQVEHRGDLAVRGSIVDVYPSTADAPVRIDLWGDEVDRLTTFAVSDQRSTGSLSEVEIHPCREVLPTHAVRERAEELLAAQPWGREQWERLAEGAVFDGMESWLPWLAPIEEIVLDRLHADALVVVLEPRRCRDRAADLLAEEADLARTLATTWGVPGDAPMPPLHLPFDRLLATTEAPLWSLPLAQEGPDIPAVDAAGISGRPGEEHGPAALVENLLSDGWRVVVAAEGAGSAQRLSDLLAERGLALPVVDAGSDLRSPGGRIVVAPLERGVLLSNEQLAVVTETELTGRRRAHRPRRARRRDAQGFFDDLTPGDHVVHQHHGVARYGGMVTRAIGGVERDYLLLEYRGDDRLYVPVDQIDTVRHYTGGDSPSLSRMGGTDWQKAKAKVRSAVQEIAQELVVLYQKRLATPGTGMGEDTPWQAELEQSFGYQETPDQLTAIADVKQDLEHSVPMDRLICGDVGFGKTEVALRAAFKVIQAGYQVALLVPTTLLAQQHFQTFTERFAPYPIRVEVLSRFLTTAQARQVSAGITSGEVDLVIGTHRLLSEDIAFPKLGLLIVDEEQRFGVKHKESIKNLRHDVHVLTLSATPIPRTLEMSLTGIRDLTILNTPPADRQPILTYVGEYDDRAVAEAIRRELLREGQVFFVHNRVMDIEHVAAHVRELVPEARVAVAHGQMDEASLEQVVFDFWEGSFDVLVCTTIIESGIDMPTVNTLVVDRADLLGLGQLHQLRGRVGRAGSRAYAYLFTPRDRVLTEEAYERLKTIAEATELGSGFKIAMRDLEIRGAGNLLGTGQSGHIAAVGYDLYCQLVTEAVAELKGEEPEEVVEVTLELPIAAHLPTEYVPKEELRLEAYRRLAAVTTEVQVDDIRDEWQDRYGPPPPPAAALLDAARLRAACVARDIRDIVVTKGSGGGFGGPRYQARIRPVTLRTSKQLRLERLYKHAVYKAEPRELVLPISAAAKAVDELLAALDELVPLEVPASADA